MPSPNPQGRLQATIEIECSPKEVWGILGDFEEVELWAPGITDAYRTTGPDIDVGSRRTVHYRHLFRMEQVVTEWTEGKSLTYDVFKTPWPLRNFQETWTLTPSVSGARVHTEVEYELWFGKVGRFVNWIFTRHVLSFEMRAGQRGLKRKVETGHP